eukprot:g20095.t1
MTKSKTSLAPFDTQKMVAPVEMFKTQSVRDLFHVIASPHLLRPNGYLPLIDDSFTASLFSFVSDEDAFVSDSADDTAKQGKEDLQENKHYSSSSRVLAWLQKLDATDNAAHLIEFLKTEKHHVRLGYYFSLLLEYFFRHCPARFVLEVETNGVNRGKTIFQKEASKTRLWHVESAIHCSIAPEHAKEREVLAARSNGAFLYESLLWRLLEYKQRIMKVQEAWRMMKSRGKDRSVSSVTLESKLLLRGWVFWPLNEWMAPITGTGGPAGGHRAEEFLSDAATLRFRDSSQKSFFHRDPASSSPSSSSPLPRFSSSTCGFWTKEPEKDLRRVKITHNGYGEQEAVTVTHWVLLLHKRYWLSPCVAWNDQLAGDPRIDLGPLPVHGLEQAVEAVREYREANPRNPLFLSGLRREQNTNTGLYMYKECCRGVVLPRKWDTQHCVFSGDKMSSVRLEDCDSLASIQDYLGRTVLKDENRQHRPVADLLEEEGGKILRQSRAVVASAAAVLWMPAEPTERLASTDLFGPHSAAAPPHSVKGCVGERAEDYADYAVGVALGDVMARMTRMHLPRANTPGAVIPGGNEQKRVRATQQQELLQATTFYFASVEREKLLRAESALFKMLAALEQVVGNRLGESRGSWSKIDVGYMLCDALARWKRMQGKHPKWAAHLQKAFEPPPPDSVQAQNTFTAMLRRSLAETLQELRRAATSSDNTQEPAPVPAAGEDEIWERRSLPLKVLVKAGRVVQSLDFATALNVVVPGEEAASRGNRKERKEEDGPFEVQAMLDLKNDVEALIDQHPEAASTPAAGPILNINRTKMHLEGLRNLLQQMSGSTQGGEQTATAGGNRNSAGKYNMAQQQHHGHGRERRSAGGSFFCLPETVRVLDCDPSMSREDFWARVVCLQEMSMSSHTKEQNSGPRIAIDCEWGRGIGGRSARGGSELDDRSPDDRDLREGHALEESFNPEDSFNPEGVALAQVAISLHEVVLYDFTQRSHRQAFRFQILQNVWGRVVCYAFHNDLRKLQTSFAACGGRCGRRIAGFDEIEMSEGDALWDLQEKIVDLQNAAQNGFFTPLMQEKSARSLQGKPKPGLAVVVEMLLGRPLDKSAQRSDWVRRPLTTAQRNYAALDAYVLLLLDDKLLLLDDKLKLL